MIKFFLYIYYKSYYFCIRIFKEKEFPQIWAGSVVAFLIFTNIVVLLEIVEYWMLPQRINIYSEYHKFFALAFIGIMQLYLHINKRYLRLLDYYKDIPETTKRVFRILSIVYYISLAFGFFFLALLLRENNIANQN